MLEVEAVGGSCTGDRRGVECSCTVTAAVEPGEHQLRFQNESFDITVPLVAALCIAGGGSEVDGGG